jgi:ring-1,2-phenylacetyl-CoA epoxidase subunit PaaD
VLAAFGLDAIGRARRPAQRTSGPSACPTAISAACLSGRNLVITMAQTSAACRQSAAQARAWAAAAAVVDPEIPVLTIADLGVLRAVRVEADVVEAIITPTYSGCPAMAAIAVDINTALAKAGFARCKITTVVSPAWTTDFMTEEGRAKLREFGIAPPSGKASRRALFGEEQVDCPRCGSACTTRVSEFGSTACKALYRCDACREPFDYFKCI